MKKKIITISRQFGSGGRSIGKAVAEKLGYEYYDSELAWQVAKKTGFDQSFVAEAGEYAPGKSMLSYAFGTSHHSSGAVNASDYLWSTQCSVINELAEKGNCVIVGRCADYILRNREDCLNVFIHASTEYKAERIVELYGVRDESPEKRLNEKDTKRRVNYKYFTGREWGIASNYHICLDSGVLTPQKCVEIICEAAE